MAWSAQVHTGTLARVRFALPTILPFNFAYIVLIDVVLIVVVASVVVVAVDVVVLLVLVLCAGLYTHTHAYRQGLDSPVDNDEMTRRKGSRAATVG